MFIVIDTLVNGLTHNEVVRIIMGDRDWKCGYVHPCAKCL
jgi:hypothetical protein